MEIYVLLRVNYDDGSNLVEGVFSSPDKAFKYWQLNHFTEGKDWFEVRMWKLDATGGRTINELVIELFHHGEIKYA